MKICYKILVIMVLIFAGSFTCQSQDMFLSDSQGNIYSLTIKNCALTKLCKLAYTFYDIAIGPDGYLYGISNNKIVKVDITTCKTEKIIPLTGNGNSLVCSNGLLYMLLGKELWTYDIANDAFKNLGNTGFSSAGDLTFFNGKLYLTAVGNQIVEINIADPSKSTLIHSITYSSQLNGIVSANPTGERCTGMTMCALGADGSILKYNMDNNSVSLLCKTNITFYGGASMYEDQSGINGTLKNDTVCNFAKPYQLSAPAGYTYSWNTGDTAQSISVSNAGQYTVIKRIDSCIAIDTFNVTFIENHAHVNTPASVCKGKPVTITSVDNNCSQMQWFANATATTPLYSGCSYTFTLNSDSQCVYFEPNIHDPTVNTLGANSYQAWGTETNNIANFNVLNPVVLDGFSVNGDQYDSGCDKFTAVITVEQGGVVVAGPISKTLNCDGSVVNNITGLGIYLPEGNGYSLKVSGATLKPTTGSNIVSKAGLLTVSSSGPFYNWKVYSNVNAIQCAIRDKICVTSSGNCCPDTTLKFATSICSSGTFDLSTLKTTTTSAGVWSILQSPAGSSPAVITGNIFNSGKNGDAGQYKLLYTISGGPYASCADSNVRTITINPSDSAKIALNQGPFCMDDSVRTLSLKSGSSAGLWSGTGINNIGKFDPNLAGAGSHKITYQTGGLCKAVDTIRIVVHATPVAPQVSSISICQNSTSGSTSLTATASAGSTLNWYGTNATGGISTSTASTYTSSTVDTVSYYVSQSLSGCEGPRAKLDVVIKAVPDLPSITNPLAVCQNGIAPDLSTIASGKGLLWYTAATGGTGSNITPIASTNTAGTFDNCVSQTVNGCESVRSKVSYTINSIPTAPIVSSPINLCKDATAQALSATASGTDTLNWYTTGVGGTASSSSPIPLTSSVGTQKYWVSQTGKGCEGQRSEIDITILPNPNVDAIVPSLICQGDTLKVSLSFTGVAPFLLTYVYNGQQGQVTIAKLGYSFNLLPTDNGNISFIKLTDAICVTAYNNFIQNYLVTKLPNLNLSGKDTICNKQAVVIDFSSTSATANYVWTTSNMPSSIKLIGSASTAIEINQTLENTSKLPLQVKYSITAYNAGCRGENKTKTVTVLPGYIPILPDTLATVCKGTTLDLNAGFVPFGYSLSWYKNDSLLTGKTNSLLHIVVTDNDFYKVLVLDYCKQEEEAIVKTSIYERQHLSDLIAHDSCAKFVSNFWINAGPILDNTKWYFEPVAESRNVIKQQSHSNYIYPTPGSYKIKVEGYLGTCLLADTMVNFSTVDCSIILKNTFTPNGDNENDVWYIHGIENYPNASLEIFNRWGVRLKYYDRHIPNYAWDGRNSEGQEVENGTYYYILSLDKGLQPIKGYINLLK